MGDGVGHHGPMAHPVTGSEVARVRGTGKVQRLQRGGGRERGRFDTWRERKI